MSKPVVDDAMVARAQAEFLRLKASGASWGEWRSILEAALTPEPEIPVTEEMKTEGIAECYGRHIVGNIGDTDRARGLVTRIYRAMESVRRKAEKPKCEHDPGIIRFDGIPIEHLRYCPKCGSTVQAL